MHTVERLERALATAQQVGLGVRYEYLNGVNGGICEIAGKKWIFVDLALPVEEQLTLVVAAVTTILAGGGDGSQAGAGCATAACERAAPDLASDHPPGNLPLTAPTDDSPPWGMSPPGGDHQAMAHRF